MLAKILLVLTVIGLIGCIVDIFGGTDLSMCITKAIDNLVDVAIYLYFIKYAKEVNDYL